MRCYIRDPDGDLIEAAHLIEARHLIEVDQTTLPGGWSEFLVEP